MAQQGGCTRESPHGVSLTASVPPRSSGWRRVTQAYAWKPFLAGQNVLFLYIPSSSLVQRTHPASREGGGSPSTAQPTHRKRNHGLKGLSSCNHSDSHKKVQWVQGYSQSFYCKLPFWTRALTESNFKIILILHASQHALFYIGSNTNCKIPGFWGALFRMPMTLISS